MNRKSLKSEIIRCGTDSEYFIRKYAKIQHPDLGLIPFDTFDYQSDLLKTYQDNRFVVILKSRQLGISEITAAYATWMMLFHRDKNILVVATKKDVARNIIRKVKTLIQNLPPWLLITEVTTDNVFSMEFSNGSRIKAASTKKDAGRSEALSLLIIDEAAHVEGMDQLWTGLRPTVAAGGKVFVLSTPNGVGNMFHRLYSEADLRENEFAPVKLMWWLHPGRQKNLRPDPMRPGFMTSDWFENECRELSSREIAQEYECNFNASGDNMISSEILDLMEKEDVQIPVSFEYLDRNMHIFQSCVAGTTYFVTADVARGDGRDGSGAHFWNASTMEQVAEYYGKVPTDEFARILCTYGQKYNNGLLVVENNTIGLAVLRDIQLLEYPNVYYSAKGDMKPGRVINTALMDPHITELVPGFTTSPKTRPLMLAKLEEYIRTQKVKFRSKRLIEELRKFVWHNGRAEAMRGYNDDLTMAAALGCWIKDTFLSSNFMTAEINKMLLEMTSQETRDNTMIPGATKDPRFVRQNERSHQHRYSRQTPYQLHIAPGVIEDLGWLITRK
jgi:hypothetical protein